MSESTRIKDFWNHRYSSDDYAYGTEPNTFFKESLDRYNFTGNILLPAEGEGRNAIYAAKNKLDVFAFDISKEGKKKALKLAQSANVEINYQLGDLSSLYFKSNHFDVAALIYAHFPPFLITSYHRRIADFIKPSGWIVLEGFSRKQLDLRKTYPNNGGPNDINSLFTIESIAKDFFDFEIVLLEERTIKSEAGMFHDGMSSVVRFIGTKSL